ncbi:DUF4880 domain-containing protein [Sphingomonas sp. ABOLD]|uniref:Transmembrane sensor n=1 Tax=Sphingomonas trueperi TaxID=53317 RepID=A0A7X5Y1S8_9SPHN|nr:MULTISPECIES: FecR domain-containing protein [Sphingomonas]NJB99519.1 transmembrane sensor [Sphingomonas trueperi]RSV42899.1 DUF4880 domain-containing protein [Sphingomonas sp. ABOLE]RSV43789.1 DUF4880 domain-containing protein [Sphingomonas sp. ABOLD]
MDSRKEGEAREGDAIEQARAYREATDWLIRLDEEPESPALRIAFAAWLAASPANAQAWGDTAHASDVLSLAFAPSPRVVPIEHALDRRRQRHRLVRGLFAGGAVAAAACILLWAGPSLLTNLRADHVAPTGEVRTIHLADGTLVKLAPGGALAVDYSDGQRHVRLLRGKAFFDVVHDRSRPFRMGASGATVTVLGTAFEVQAREDGVGVAVRRGRVRVACATAAPDAILSVGQSADMACDAGKALRADTPPERIASWIDGQYVATDRPIRDVVDALRPWYRGIIVARGEGLETRRVTGVYDLRHPQEALAALAAAHMVRVTQVTPWITIVTSD